MISLTANGLTNENNMPREDLCYFDNNTKQMPSLRGFKNKLKKDMLDRLYS